MPAFFRGKSPNACLAWCARFMKRSRLTIRRVTHSGRKTRTQLDILKDAFVIDVSDVRMAHFIDPVTQLPLCTAVFNMDQTAIFCTLGSKTTVEFIGKETVPAVCGGNDSWRCTVALTASANGRMHALHFVFKAEPGGEVEREVRAFAVEEVATFSVQRNAWFDVRVMLEWIENCWRFIVSEPCILILDSLAVHKCDAVVEALAHYGTAVKFVPGGCAGVAQLLDVGVMGPLKSHIRTSYAEYYSFNPFPDTAAQRRKDMYVRTMDAIANISNSTVGNSFHKAGPFIPLGPSFNESEEVAEEEEEEEAIVYAF